MEIEIHNAVELFFPNPTFQQIYFEAVANALDAGANDILINVRLRSFSKPQSLSIEIVDNGEGFTDSRFDRFSKLLLTEDAYHKGLGRLVFLRYFQSIEIDSHYAEGHRYFIFSADFKGRSKLSANENKKRETRLVFNKFAGKTLKSYDDVRASSIIKQIKLEMMPRLYEMRKNGLPLKITVNLDVQEGNPAQDFYSDKEVFQLSDLPDLKEVKINDPAIDMFDSISMAYRIENKFGESSVSTVASVDGRTIPLDLIPPDSIPNNYSVVFLFNSKLFKANNSRQSLEFKDEVLEKLLFKVLRKHVAGVINMEIPAVKNKNERTKELLVGRYPHLMGYFEEETVGLIQREEALDNAQKRFFKDQKEILEASSLDDTQFEKSIELSSRTLTEYVLYRSLIIKKMGQMSERNTEAEIHELIVPRFKTFKGADLPQQVYNNNAWLLDDKFMTFTTILSDERMSALLSQITLSTEQQEDESRPDISMIFSDDPERASKVDVVVVELKKRTDDEKENSYALVQLLQRAEKLVHEYKNIQRIWYYAIMQINDSFAIRLQQQRYSPLFSKGRVFYREDVTLAPDGSQVPTPIFVVSFDAVVKDAESRNSTFLRILREGMKRIAKS